MKNKVIKQLKQHEGFRANPYKCTAGALTIGYGHNLDAKVITLKQAEYLLNDDVDAAIKDAKALFKNFDELDENRQIVLVNMAFNIGRRRLSTFKRLINAIENYDYKQASLEMTDSKWARQLPKRAFTLARIMKEG